SGITKQSDLPIDPAGASSANPPEVEYHRVSQMDDSPSVEAENDARVLIGGRHATMSGIRCHQQRLSAKQFVGRCPACHQQVTSRLTYRIGSRSCTTAALLVCPGGLFILPAAFFWLPLLLDNFKDVVHTCPLCKCEIGCYKRR
uniref:LITAF domain-containing protein n=1 Tax=Macrostomum lignano TaxID=282301 RepID=A0A1I8GYN4_9PLAT